MTGGPVRNDGRRPDVLVSWWRSVFRSTRRRHWRGVQTFGPRRVRHGSGGRRPFGGGRGQRGTGGPGRRGNDDYGARRPTGQRVHGQPAERYVVPGAGRLR